jgi:hypothetical protein
MTWTVSAGGHGDEPYEERRAVEMRLLTGLVRTLQVKGGHVGTFAFTGNEIHVANWEAAKALVANEDD